MTLIEKLELKLKRCASYDPASNYPVGIITSTNGRFMVYYTITTGKRFHDRLSGAINEILEWEKRQ